MDSTVYNPDSYTRNGDSTPSHTINLICVLYCIYGLGGTTCLYVSDSGHGEEVGLFFLFSLFYCHQPIFEVCTSAGNPDSAKLAAFFVEEMKLYILAVLQALYAPYLLNSAEIRANFECKAQLSFRSEASHSLSWKRFWNLEDVYHNGFKAETLSQLSNTSFRG